MAKRWSAAEDAVIRETSSAGLTLTSQMHRLPGRSFVAAKTRASKIGVSASNARAWSDEERAALREIYASRETIKLAARRLLPDRSYLSIKAEAMRLGVRVFHRTGRLGYSWVWRAIERALDEADLTIAQLVGRTGASTNAITKAIARRRAEVHIGGWVREATTGKICAQWALGRGRDAPRPQRKSSRAACRDYRIRQRVRAGVVDPFASLRSQVVA